MFSICVIVSRCVISVSSPISVCIIVCSTCYSLIYIYIYTIGFSMFADGAQGVLIVIYQFVLQVHSMF